MFASRKQRRNPIIREALRIGRAAHDSAAQWFDNANGAAWEAAGMPDDEPGTEWWDFESEALTYLGRKFR